MEARAEARAAEARAEAARERAAEARAAERVEAARARAAEARAVEARAEGLVIGVAYRSLRLRGRAVISDKGSEELEGCRSRRCRSPWSKSCRHWPT